MSPQQFADIVLSWYEKHGRHNLPWQIKPNPYRVWISEIMLQQTQVTTVIPYYQKFLKSFPNVKSLASAHEDDVLSHWSGLGYYARARNLHKTAKLIVNKHKGKFPDNVEEIIALPGIGRSTAGAIVSFSMKIRAAILDANVKRVLSRFHTIEDLPTQSAIDKELWQIAELYTPQERVNHYNQAMMDLGATICVRNKPACPKCPLISGCKAHALGREQYFPSKKLKKEKPLKKIYLLIIKNKNGEILLEKRPPVGIWGGLWSLPQCPISEDIAKWVRTNYQIKIEKKIKLPMEYHQFSHFKLEMQPYILLVKNNHRQIMESSRQLWYNCVDPLPGGIATPIKKIIGNI